MQFLQSQGCKVSRQSVGPLSSRIIDFPRFGNESPFFGFRSCTLNFAKHDLLARIGFLCTIINRCCALEKGLHCWLTGNRTGQGKDVCGRANGDVEILVSHRQTRCAHINIWLRHTANCYSSNRGNDQATTIQIRTKASITSQHEIASLLKIGGVSNKYPQPVFSRRIFNQVGAIAINRLCLGENREAWALVVIGMHHEVLVCRIVGALYLNHRCVFIRRCNRLALGFNEL